MLSRIAESLYWIGRYVERAEDTSRILDVHLSLLVEDPWAPEDVVCGSLLAAMGRETAAVVGSAEILDYLAWDFDDATSVVGAIGAARENARRSREIISTELWQSINVTWLDCTSAELRARPHAFFSWVRERASAFNGVADATTSRDDAWHFLTLGRSIERADMTARLVAARALSGSVGPSWVTLLQSCGAYQSFLRSSRGAVEDRRAIEFLLLDQLFPRSLISALVTAEQSLDELDHPGPSRDPGWHSRHGGEAHRVLGMIRSELEFAPTAELLDDLYNVMERVQSACSVASDAVTRRYFPHGTLTSWMVS